MEDDQLTSILLDIGLPEREVEHLVEQYDKMQTQFQNGEYELAGVHVGKFGEGVAKLLQRKIEDKYTDESMREFAQRYLSGDVDAEVSERIQRHIPNMLHTAWTIRSDRNAAHLHLEKPIKKADAQLGIMLCSSMLIELVREFASEEDNLDVDQVTALLEGLAEPVEENPLQSLVQSRTEFDRETVADVLDGYIVIVEEGGVQPGPEFSELAKSEKAIALGLGRLAAYTLGHTDEIGAEEEWYRSRSDGKVTSHRLDGRDCIFQDEELGGYYLPGHQVVKAISTLQDE